MKLKQSWKDELLALVNSKNSLQLTLADVKFELTEPVSEVPRNGCCYDQTER